MEFDLLSFCNEGVLRRILSPWKTEGKGVATD